MYHPIGIQKLSENQLSRLRNGHPVRVKIGSHHKIHLSVPQLKKLHTAHKNGKASTITFDPYQNEAHGSGLFGDIARKAKQFVQKYHLQDVVNPVIHKAKRVGHHAVNRASQYAHSQIDRLQPIEGNGMAGMLSNYAIEKTIGNPYSWGKGRGLKHTTHKGKGLFGGILSGASGLSNLIGGPGSDEASKVLGTIGGIANTLGLGVARKHHTSHTKKRRARKGKGFLEDVGKVAKQAGKEIAKKGISIGTDYLNGKIDGLGVRPKLYKRKQRKYHGGGALMPAGTGLYPAGYSP